MNFEETMARRRELMAQARGFSALVFIGRGNADASFTLYRNAVTLALLEVVCVDPFKQAAENLQQSLAKAEGRFENMELCEPIKRTREERMKPNQPFYMTVPKRRKRR